MDGVDIVGSTEWELCEGGWGEVERKAWCGIHCVVENGIMRMM